MFLVNLKLFLIGLVGYFFDRIPGTDIRLIIYAGYPTDYKISGRITGYCGRIKKVLSQYSNTLELRSVRMSLCPSKSTYVCMSVSQSEICLNCY